ncbi:hypothetical protein NDA18_001392 [Ustilago nuda]|nr:hypothetical protein NDA18_001392 [Ustilago nuda]
MLPPTLNSGSSPASPAMSTTPHDAPSSPILPGLPASPRKKLLYDTLKKPFDDQDSFSIYWVQTLDVATLPNIGRRKQTLLERIDQSALFQPTLDPVDRLALVLQHAFVPGAPRRVRMPLSDFTSTFNGQALEMLVHHIKVQNQLNCPSKFKYFTKVLPIIQSSGFGKTRLCVQLSTICPGTPPWVIRNRASALSHTQRRKMRFNEAHLSILAWLAIYCQTTAYYLIQLQHASGCFDPPAHHQDPAACWRAVVFYYARTTGLKEGSLFETPSNLCHQSRLPHLCSTDIPPSTDNPLAHVHPANQAADLPPSLLATPRIREKILDYICETATTLASTMKGQYSCQLSYHELLTHSIRDHLKPSLQLVEHLFRDADPNSFFFLALDKCSSIDTLLPYIRLVWFFAVPKMKWILLIDTNPKLAPRAAARESRQASRRPSEFDIQSFPQPFSAMPLDPNLTSQHLRTLSSGGGQLTMRDLDAFLPRFGRPLWMDSRYYSDGFIMPRATINKLVSRVWIWPDELKDYQSDPLGDTIQNLIALASRRLHLDLSSKAGPQIWYPFVRNQIACRLRYVGRIYSTSDSIKSGTPGEPPLSLAVAWSVRSKPELVAAK